MPQATDALRDRWDGEAHAIRSLLPNFYITFGSISPKQNYQPTEADLSAIDYLIQEWDYAYFQPKA